MKKNTTVEVSIGKKNHPIYRITDWDNYQQYSKTSKRYVRQMPWFKFYARELLQQRRFFMMPPEQFKFLVLLMCFASQDDGYLLFEDLEFQFRGVMNADELERNLNYLEDVNFIHQVEKEEFYESRSYGTYRTDNNDSDDKHERTH